MASRLVTSATVVCLCMAPLPLLAQNSPSHAHSVALGHTPIDLAAGINMAWPPLRPVARGDRVEDFGLPPSWSFAMPSEPLLSNRSQAQTTAPPKVSKARRAAR